MDKVEYLGTAMFCFFLSRPLVDMAGAGHCLSAVNHADVCPGGARRRGWLGLAGLYRA